MEHFARYFPQFVCEGAYLHALLRDLCGMEHFTRFFPQFVSDCLNDLYLCAKIEEIGRGEINDDSLY